MSFECPECGDGHGVWIGETLFGGVGRCQECGGTFNVTDVKLEWDEWTREEWAAAELQPGILAGVINQLRASREYYDQGRYGKMNDFVITAEEKLRRAARDGGMEIAEIDTESKEADGEIHG